jgi:hypothetical protein
VSITGDLAARRPRIKHPTGWEPGIDTAAGHVTYRTNTRPDETVHDWTFILEDYGLDPKTFRVVEPVQVRSWDANVGDGQVQRLYYYRAAIRSSVDDVDYDDLLDRIRKKPDRRIPDQTDGGRSLVVCLSDWQLGKCDGEGTAGVVNRVKALQTDLKTHGRRLRKTGVQIDQLVVLGLGDLVEGCSGWYPMQAWNVELDQRGQLRLAYELITALLDDWAGEFPKLVVAAVAGNHGENRQAGKAYTTFGDSLDIQAFEIVQHAFQSNPGRYPNIGWLIPANELSISLEASGTIIGMAHGHQTRGSKHAATRVWDWWQGQQMGRRPVADADILVTGHYHYLSVVANGGRTHIQVPPLDSGSDWFAERYGMETTAGAVVFTVGQDRQANHLTVL